MVLVTRDRDASLSRRGDLFVEVRSRNDGVVLVARGRDASLSHGGDRFAVVRFRKNGAARRVRSRTNGAARKKEDRRIASLPHDTTARHCHVAARPRFVEDALSYDASRDNALQHLLRVEGGLPPGGGLTRKEGERCLQRLDAYMTVTALSEW